MPTVVPHDAPLDEAYFVWLYAQVGETESKNLANTYWKLLKLLYTKPFAWILERDESRAKDGTDQRMEFLRETDLVVDEPGWLDQPCSVLEMMIALAWKLEFDSTNGEDQAYWFWQMIKNLGLIEFTDAHPPRKEVVDEILDRVLYREYAPNGKGGLFPLQRSARDQRTVELAYQGEAYLLERI